ncbi:MAG TPA: C4-type zinc ribbon domain-containing protein [Thermodesulfovibrionales bacterium]|nr:C4-type zinc ribbon domain-containing protein [Thermodesulfovibrionales bacterium]
MREDIKALIEVQKIDSDIAQKAALIEAIPKKVSSVEQPLREARSLYEKAKQRYEAHVKKKKEKEGLLDEIHEKIKKLKGRTLEIKTNKEYQAHLKEIESVEREQRGIEDEVLFLMEAADTVQNELKTDEAKVRSEEEKVEVFKKKLKEEVTETEQEMDVLKLQREQLVRGIEGELYHLYVQLLETKKGLAVVETRDEVCQGCYMNIPPQLFVEIKKNEKIIQCPQCNRILYWNT